jgi:hypothetical protein
MSDRFVPCRRELTDPFPTINSLSRENLELRYQLEELKHLLWLYRWIAGTAGFSFLLTLVILLWRDLHQLGGLPR